MPPPRKEHHNDYLSPPTDDNATPAVGTIGLTDAQQVPKLALGMDHQQLEDDKLESVKVVAVEYWLDVDCSHLIAIKSKGCISTSIYTQCAVTALLYTLCSRDLYLIPSIACME